MSQTWWNICLSKFPAFNPAWPDDVQSKWWHAFDRLLLVARRHEAEREAQGGS